MIYPRRLKPGDTIAIISPASIVKNEYVLKASEIITGLGYEVKIMPHALDSDDGTYAAPLEDRLSDFISAYTDSSVRAILCARGGYGAVHLIDRIKEEMLANDPKWLIGYSDISAFHAMMNKVGIVSVHAPMAKHIAEEGGDDKAVKALFDILAGTSTIDYTLSAHPYNRIGKAKGVLRGGNFAVLSGLNGAPCDMFDVTDRENVILFIEDISEAVYSTERMLYNLKLRGTLGKIKGLIVGQFTEYKPDKNFNSTEDMIHARLKEFGIEHIPVAFNFPTGHVKDNLPLIEGANVELAITDNNVRLIFE